MSAQRFGNVRVIAVVVRVAVQLADTKHLRSCPVGRPHSNPRSVPSIIPRMGEECPCPSPGIGRVCEPSAVSLRPRPWFV
jgi:hypothetical protein